MPKVSFLETEQEPSPKGFRIHDSKGYHMTFANGCTVSVQFGYGNYCDSNQKHFEHFPREGVQSPTAEVAAWGPDDQWLYPAGFDFNGDDVIGNLTPNEVAKFIQAVAEMEISNAPSA